MNEEVVGSTHALVCQSCGAPLTRGTYKCEYCGTEYRREAKDEKADNTVSNLANAER